jgi:hypothetical protein
MPDIENIPNVPEIAVTVMLTGSNNGQNSYVHLHKKKKNCFDPGQ